MDSIPEADRYFTLGATLDTANVIGFAGWAIVGWVRGSHAASIFRADLVLRHVPAFVFQYDEGITQRTMTLTKGYGYFHLSDYQNCIDEILVLDVTYSAPGLSDPAIHSQLLAKLDALNAGQF